MQDRSSLLQKIDEVSFAVNEATLYLDTHPDCQEGLTYFYKMAKERSALLKEFAENYEPLTVDCICKTAETQPDHFLWLDGTAPWEGGAN